MAQTDGQQSMRKVVRLEARAGRAGAMREALGELRKATIVEEGCREFDFYQSITASGAFLLVEDFAGQAALDPQRRAVPDHAEAAGAVVVAPGDPGWRPRARLVALVRGDIGGIAGRQLARALHPPAQEVAEGVAGLDRPDLLVAGKPRAIGFGIP